MGAGLAAVLTLAWSWAPRAGAPPLAVFAGALALAVLSRSASLLAPGAEDHDELAWLGLLVGLGLPVAFLRFGPGMALKAVLVAVSVAAVWWQTGLVAQHVRSGLSRDLARPAADLARETQGGVFGMLVLAAAVATIAPHMLPGTHPGAGRLATGAIAAQAAAGSILIADNHRRALLRRAATEGAAVLPGLAGPGRAVAAAAALLFVTAALPALPAVLLPRTIGGAVVGLIRFLAPHAAAPGVHTASGAASGPASFPSAAGGAGGARTAPSGLPQGAWRILGLLAAAAVAAGLARSIARSWRRGAGARARGRRGGLGLGGLLAEIWYLFLSFFAGLFSGLVLAGLWRALRGEREKDAGARQGRAPGPAPAPAAGWRARGDARARVRASYRHLLRGAGARGHRRPPWYTPRAFGRDLRTALPRAHPALDRLTAIYEEARYSPHALEAADAAAAEEAADALVADLRASAGDRGAPGPREAGPGSEGAPHP